MSRANGEKRNFDLFSNEIFRLEWPMERKSRSSLRSRSEPRHLLNDLQDPNLLAEQKRDLLKKILQLQREKFKENHTKKRSKNEMDSSIYASLSRDESRSSTLTKGFFSEKNDCWDAPRVMRVRETYENSVQCYRLSMQFLKLGTYIFLHIGVLLTALISKGTLLLMTNAVSHVQEVRQTIRIDGGFFFSSLNFV